MRKHRCNSGFTLVELAIALMIIGLLIGAVLKGQELVENARSAQYVRQINAYNAALKTFQTLYNNEMPGDMENPQRSLPNCTSAPCNTVGDGSRFYTVWDAPRLLMISNGSMGYTGGKQRQFWVHLAKAGLITGVDPDYSSGTYSGDGGVEVPAGPDQGVIFGVMTLSSSPVWGAAMQRMNVYVIRGSDDSSNSYAMNGTRAYYIDAKTDDGLPGNGTTRVMGNVTNYLIDASCASTSEYNMASTAVACNIAVSFQ